MEGEAGLVKRDEVIRDLEEKVERYERGISAKEEDLLHKVIQIKDLKRRVNDQQRTTLEVQSDHEIFVRSSLTKESFRDRVGRPYPFLSALEIEPTKNGGYSTTLVLRSEDKKETEFKTGVTLAQVATNIAQQLSSNLLEINFDDTTGRYIGGEIEDPVEGTQIAFNEVVQSYRMKLAEMGDELNRLRNQKQTALIREEKTAQDLDDARTAVKTAQFGQDYSQGLSKGMMETTSNLVRDVITAYLPGLSSEVNRAMSEKYAGLLEEQVMTSQAKAATSLTREDVEDIEDRAIENMEKAIQLGRGNKSKNGDEEQPPPPPPPMPPPE